MRLPFLRPKSAAPASGRRAAPAADEPAIVQEARTRARRRLVGALVLLLIGILGFPVLFETQPRPLPVDTPIELPRREAAAPEPAPKPAAALKPRPVPVVPADSGVDEASAPPPAAVAAEASAPAATASAAVASAKPLPAPVPVPMTSPSPAAPAASVPVASAPAAARYVVQAGAYTEAPKLREARAKIEGLGLKTYTQVIETEAGQRTRVRVGPYATRDEAEAIAAKVKRSGLPANVLTL